jgi:hypothetical protein
MPSAESEPHSREEAGAPVQDTDPIPTGSTIKATEDGEPLPPAVARWVKSPCGRAKYQRLAERRGFGARLRRWWFVLIAALRDWFLPSPPDTSDAP